jgi:hypothetical protein
MLPALVESLAKASDPIRAMNRFEDLIERLPAASISIACSRRDRR